MLLMVTVGLFVFGRASVGRIRQTPVLGRVCEKRSAMRGWCVTDNEA